MERGMGGGDAASHRQPVAGLPTHECPCVDSQTATPQINTTCWASSELRTASSRQTQAHQRSDF